MIRLDIRMRGSPRMVCFVKMSKLWRWVEWLWPRNVEKAHTGKLVNKELNEDTGDKFLKINGMTLGNKSNLTSAIFAKGETWNGNVKSHVTEYLSQFQDFLLSLDFANMRPSEKCCQEERSWIWREAGPGQRHKWQWRRYPPRVQPQESTSPSRKCS